MTADAVWTDARMGAAYLLVAGVGVCITAAVRGWRFPIRPRLRLVGDHVTPRRDAPAMARNPLPRRSSVHSNPYQRDAYERQLRRVGLTPTPTPERRRSSLTVDELEAMRRSAAMGPLTARDANTLLHTVQVLLDERGRTRAVPAHLQREWGLVREILQLVAARVAGTSSSTPPPAA